MSLISRAHQERAYSRILEAASLTAETVQCTPYGRKRIACSGVQRLAHSRGARHAALCQCTELRTAKAECATCENNGLKARVRGPCGKLWNASRCLSGLWHLHSDTVPSCRLSERPHYCQNNILYEYLSRLQTSRAKKEADKKKTKKQPDYADTCWKVLQLKTPGLLLNTLPKGICCQNDRV